MDPEKYLSNLFQLLFHLLQDQMKFIFPSDIQANTFLLISAWKQYGVLEQCHF